MMPQDEQPCPSVCRDFMMNRCKRDNCRFLHDKTVCFHYWKHGTCKFGDVCKNKHVCNHRKLQTNVAHNKQQKKPKNTENFTPLDRPVDMRIVFDMGNEHLSVKLTDRDVLIAPNLFSDFLPCELYQKLEKELRECDVPQEKLLKMWHGDSHFIADDHTNWKNKAPVFRMITERVKEFFDMDIQATRFNWYQDTSQWKPFHHDASAVKPDKAKIQNFTVAVSFGATRDAAFEENSSKKVISIPQPDGCVYAFSKTTNILWKHGILKEKETRQEGRISAIFWGWVNNQITL